RLRPHLVRHPLHDHLPDRVHHAALRLQSVPHARDGAARDRARRHLQVHLAVRRDDGDLDHPADAVPANRTLAATDLHREVMPASKTLWRWETRRKRQPCTRRETMTETKKISKREFFKKAGLAT